MGLPFLEAPTLFLAGYRKPELDEMDPAAGEVALELRGLAHELEVFLVAAEAHDPLHTGAVVPGTVEKDDFPACREVLDVALEIPLALFLFGRLLEGDDPGTAGVEVLHEALDRPALARGVAAFEEDHDPLSRRFHPGLQFQQFDLQLVFLPLVIAAGHQVLVGIAALAPVLRQLEIGPNALRGFGGGEVLREKVFSAMTSSGEAPERIASKISTSDSVPALAFSLRMSSIAAAFDSRAAEVSSVTVKFSAADPWLRGRVRRLWFRREGRAFSGTGPLPFGRRREGEFGSSGSWNWISEAYRVAVRAAISRCRVRAE